MIYTPSLVSCYQLSKFNFLSEWSVNVCLAEKLSSFLANFF